LAGGLLTVCVWQANGASASAQEAPTALGAPTAPTAPQAPSGTVLMEQDSSGHYFEWTITAIGIGVATYTVCRSSRRN
jgi:hypothetical protein